MSQCRDLGVSGGFDVGGLGLCAFQEKLQSPQSDRDGGLGPQDMRAEADGYNEGLALQQL